MTSLNSSVGLRRVSALVSGITMIILALAGPAAAEAPVGVAGSASELAADSSGFERVSRIAFDLVILRPLGLIATALSVTGAVIAYPIALPFGGEGHVVDYLIKDPIDRTFRQPLGDL